MPPADDPPSHDPRTDADLLAAARRGDAAAFEALYRRHRQFVVRVAHRHAGDAELALDAAQETFIYLLRKLPTLTLTARLTTYLYPIAKNTALTLRRRRGRAIAGGVPDAASGDGPTPDAGLDVRLRAAVDALPDEQREVLLLRVVDGLSVDEVALALGVPPGTVKSRLHHALGKLRERPELREIMDG